MSGSAPTKFWFSNRRATCRPATALLFAAPIICFAQQSQVLAPIVRPGQTLEYSVEGRLQRSTKTESRVNSILEPRMEKLAFASTLHVRIIDVHVEDAQRAITATAEFLPTGTLSTRETPPAKNPITFTMASNGQLTRMEGLENLNESQQLAWQFWITRFGFGATIPADKTKVGEKWKSEEPVPAGSPIAGLSWDRSTTNGQNTQCPTRKTETCSVFFTTADLKHKGSLKDTTPEEYRIKGLRTSGTANGVNEIYTSISVSSGLVMRASEDIKQSMDVTVVKPDAANGVRYTIDVTSHFDLVFLKSE